MNVSCLLAAQAPIECLQVDAAFRLAIGRHPEEEERRRLVEYGRRHGLENVCRVVFNLNEFLFVD